jgi:hypothetical protein
MRIPKILIGGLKFDDKPSMLNSEFESEFGKKYEIHTKNVEELKSESTHLQRVRMGLKNLASRSKDLGIEVGKISSKSIMFVARLREIKALFKNRGTRKSSVLVSESDENDIRMKLQQNQALEENEVIDCLLNSLIEVHQNFAFNTQNLKDHLIDDLEMSLRSLVKDKIREARYQTQDYFDAFSVYVDALKLANNTPKPKNSAFAPKTHSRSSIHSRVSVGVQRLVNSDSYANTKEANRKYLQVRNAFLVSSHELDNIGQKTWDSISDYEFDIQKSQLPSMMIAHFKQMKRFYLEGLEFCNRVLSDDQLMLLERVMNTAKKQKYEYTSTTSNENSFLNANFIPKGLDNCLNLSDKFGGELFSPLASPDVTLDSISDNEIIHVTTRESTEEIVYTSENAKCNSREILVQTAPRYIEDELYDEIISNIDCLSPVQKVTLKIL